MKDLSVLNELIDRAAAVAGSDYRLAKALGVSRGLVSDWRYGRKPCAIEEWAIMASMAGLEADKWVIRGLMFKHEGTEKGDRLLKALGKGLAVTGGALASFGASAAAIFSSTANQAQSLIDVLRCIDLLNRKANYWERQLPLFFRPKVGEIK